MFLHKLYSSTNHFTSFQNLNKLKQKFYYYIATSKADQIALDPLQYVAQCIAIALVVDHYHDVDISATTDPVGALP